MLRGDRAFLAALLGGLLLCTLPGLWAPPAFDDRTGVIENPRIRRPGPFLEGFLAPAPPRAGDVLLPGYAYRPLTEASFGLNARVTGWSPAGLRAGNLLLHAASTLLVFLIARRLGTGLPPAFPRWAAAFFALHPLAVETVTYLYQRATGLETLLAFLSLALYLGCRAKPSWPRYLGALGAALLAMTAKESAVTLPLMLAACEWTLRDAKEPLRRVLARWLPFAALPILVLVQVLRRESPDPAAVADLAPLQYLRVQFPALAGYLRLNVLPFPLHFLHDRVRPLPPAGRATWLSGAALLALATWALFGPVRHRLPRLGATLFLASQALESSIFPILDTAFHHRCYPGLLGTGLVLAWTLTRLPRACARLAVVTLGLFAALAAAEARRWNDPLDLTARDLRHAWHVGVNWGEYAWRHLERGHPLRAERMARQGLRRAWGPKTSAAHLTALLALDRREAARAELLEDGRRFPDSPHLTRMAIQLATLEHDDATLDSLADVIAAAPRAEWDLTLWLVRRRDAQGRKQETEGILRRTLALTPDHPLFWDYLGYLLFTEQRWGESEDAYRRAVALQDSLLKAHYHLGLLDLKRGERQGAEREFKKALSLNPDYGPAKAALESLR